MPPQAPPSRAGRWIVLVLGAVLIGGVAWAFSAAEPSAPPAPERGVRTGGARGPAPARSDTERTEHERAAIPMPPQPPIPGQEAQVPNPSATPPPSPDLAGEAEVTITEADAIAALRQVQINLYATQWCGVCRRAREYLRANDIAFTEYDTEKDEAAAKRLGELNPRKSVPTFEIDDLVYVGFSEDGLEAKLNEAVRNRLY